MDPWLSEGNVATGRDGYNRKVSVFSLVFRVTGKPVF